jgi:hypothetical protein
MGLSNIAMRAAARRLKLLFTRIKTSASLASPPVDTGTE